MSDIPPIAPQDIVAWQTMRANIVQLNTIVVSLLTQSTALIFAAFAIIHGADRIGQYTKFLLGTGITLAVLMLTFAVWRFESAVRVTVESAKKLENRLFSTDPNDFRRITHLLSGHPFSASNRFGATLYYSWPILLLILSFVLTCAFKH
ncbi:MAG: hypothetical protein JWN51_2025 [Phycisphaerales bacterium]|nr:hypothetical protein [Phycisphaerales bacterium]